MNPRDTSNTPRPDAGERDTRDGRASDSEYPFPASEAEGQLARAARKDATDKDKDEVPPPTRIGDEPRQMPS